MTAILIVLVIALALALAAVILYPRRGASRQSPPTPPPGGRAPE